MTKGLEKAYPIDPSIEWRDPEAICIRCGLPRHTHPTVATTGGNQPSEIEVCQTGIFDGAWK